MMKDTGKLSNRSLVLQRSEAALANLFVGDALAMPVHWYYNPADIQRAFPGGIQQLEAAPEFHPSSIMSLHSTRQGGRSHTEHGPTPEIVGDVILKGKREFWNRSHMHYHQGMQAGENTLNAHCARLLMRSMVAHGGYDRDRFLDDYIAFMTADPPQHPDTYAESYHRGFFANLLAGHPKHQCGARTHDTPSMGGLVTVGPLALWALLHAHTLTDVQTLCREHLWLTHPDETLARVCDAYVQLIERLLFREQDEDPRPALIDAGQKALNLDLVALVTKARSDNDVVGGRFSTACYITDSWPCLLYLAYRYDNDPSAGLLANTNLGGENCHRGAVLGTILGLITGTILNPWFDAIIDTVAIFEEIQGVSKTLVDKDE